MNLQNNWKCDRYDNDFILENMMGPNSMRILEELIAGLDLRPGMRVLDLGCGQGLTSVFLAKEFGVQVTAADLWIDPTDNLRRFREMGLQDRIIPLRVDATQEIPFAQGYFDVAVSVDSYHYYGCTEGMLDRCLTPYVRSGGTIAVAVPGLQKDFTEGIPEELRPFLPEDANFFSCGWWSRLWKQSSRINLERCWELGCCTQAWEEWLASSNPYAVSDRKMMAVEGGRYFNIVGLIATVL